MDLCSINEETQKRLSEYAETMLENPEGRFFLNFLLGASDYFSVQKSASLGEAAFAEGKRAVGGLLFAIVLKCPNREQLFREDK